MKKKGMKVLLGLALCISMAFTAVPGFATEKAEPSTDENGVIHTTIDTQYNETKKRNEMIASIGEEEMDFLIWQEGEYGFGGLRWTIWGGVDDTYTEIRIKKKLLKKAYQKTDVPVEIETVLGNYCISNDLMRYLVKKGKGQDIRVVLEKVTLTEKQKKIYGEDAYACRAYFLSGGKKITDLGYNNLEITLSVRTNRPGGTSVGRINSKGKLYPMESRFGGQVGNYKCQFETTKLGTFIITSGARIAYAKRVTAVTSATLNVKAAGVKNGVKISWKKLSGLKNGGYQVYASSKKNGTYKRIRTTTKTSYSDSGLKSGAKRYYKVRAFATINGTKVYSKWSKIKTAAAK